MRVREKDFSNDSASPNRGPAKSQAGIDPLEREEALSFEQAGKPTQSPIRYLE